MVLSARGVFADGAALCPAGNRAVAVAAKAHRVPVIVLAGTHQISPLGPDDPEYDADELESPAGVFEYAALSSDDGDGAFTVANPVHDRVAPTHHAVRDRRGGTGPGVHRVADGGVLLAGRQEVRRVGARTKGGAVVCRFLCASRNSPETGRRTTARDPRRRRKYRSVATNSNSGERHTAKRVAAVRRTVRRSAMVGLGLNLSGVARGDGLAAPLTSRGDADGNVNVHEKTVGPEETRRGEASSSSGSDDDSDVDAPIAERSIPTTRPAGLPSLGLGLSARAAAAAGGSSASSPTSPPSGTSLSARKPPGLGLRIGGGGGAGDVGSGGGRPSAIDLESLRDSGETHASELTIRREKFAHFEKHCTRVAPSVFVAGEAVARDLATLREHGITHIINCNAFVIPNHFENVLTYKSLWLQDSPGEDVTRVLYDCFDFIRAARAAGGNALVHCSQGVSRSVSVVISFLMWESGASYEEVFARVKAQRGIANPNMGFTCQMLRWRKRVAAEAAWGRRPPMSPTRSRSRGRACTAWRALRRPAVPRGEAGRGGFRRHGDWRRRRRGNSLGEPLVDVGRARRVRGGGAADERARRSRGVRVGGPAVRGRARVRRPRARGREAALRVRRARERVALFE